MFAQTGLLENIESAGITSPSKIQKTLEVKLANARNIKTPCSTYNKDNVINR